MKLLNNLNRVLIMIMVTLLYVLATLLGILIFNYFNGITNSLILSLLLADLAATIFVYLVSTLVNNASMYDPYWSVAPPVIILLLMFHLNAFNAASWLIFIIVAIWSMRLTGNWIYTFKSFKYQDWRYTLLKEKSGNFYPLVNLFGIHVIPTLFVFAALVPVIVVLQQGVTFNIWMIIGAFISLGAIGIELIADYQMQVFRSKMVSRSQIIRVGLWKHSRHPNYLGEITFWWGLYLMSAVILPLNNFWWLIFGPLAMTIMFLIISVPMTEKRLSLIKDNFNQYKAETRMFLPIKKKSS
jgi:steroid 5-alpha reductase family enzyme